MEKADLIACCMAQDILVAISQPTPGIASGLLVNSTVFLLGIKILLRGVLVPMHASQYMVYVAWSCFPMILVGAYITPVGVQGPYTQGQVANGCQLYCTACQYLANGCHMYWTAC
jgi:hypothetical protein